jgi:hypothetical protein
MKTSGTRAVLFGVSSFVVLVLGIRTASGWMADFYNGIPLQAKKNIFFDEFKDNANGWKFLTDSATWAGRIENGCLYWESKEKSAYFAQREIAINQNGNFEIEAKIKYVKGGNPATGFGLIWGKEGGRYFIFQINANGSFSIDKYENEWQPIKDWTPSSALNTNDFNKLTLRKVGGVFTFFLNEELVWRAPFVPFFGPLTGVLTSPYATILVDEFRVSAIEETSAQAKRAAAEGEVNGGWGEAEVGDWIEYDYLVSGFGEYLNYSAVVEVIAANDKSLTIKKKITDDKFKSKSTEMTQPRFVKKEDFEKALAQYGRKENTAVVEVSGKKLLCDVYKKTIKTEDGSQVSTWTHLCWYVPNWLVRVVVNGTVAYDLKFFKSKQLSD